MTQTKNKSKKSMKKQPVKVQLSKQDLVELLTVLKNFIVEELQETIRNTVLAELSNQNRKVFSNQHELDIRVARIEKERISEGVNRVIVCPHKDKLAYISYSEISGCFLAAVYKCKWCGREDRKTPTFLTRKEKKALNRLGVIVK